MAVESQLPVALWVVPVGEFGGVARHVTDVAQAGLPGFRQVVLAPTGALTARLRELGTEVVEADFGTQAGFATSYKTLNELIDRLSPAVVHSHLAYADFVAATVVTARKLKKLFHGSPSVPQLVTTEHGIAGNDAVYHSSALRATGRKLAHRIRLLLTERKIAVSRSTAEQMFLKWGARGLEVIRNGVDVDAVRAAMSVRKVESALEGPRILSLSRLSPEKGLDVLVLAFAQVLETYPDARLEIAGQGESGAELKSLCNRLGISDAVNFSGFQDPYEAMGRNDVVVQLSVWENLSYTLLDAKAAGLMVLATDVGGNPEIVGQEELVEDLCGLPREQAVSTVARQILRSWRNRNRAAGPGPLTSVSTMTEKISRGYRKGEK